MSKQSFSDDEKANMVVRVKNGESKTSIARDYDTTFGTIRYHTDPEYQEKQKTYNKERLKRKYHSDEVYKKNRLARRRLELQQQNNNLGV